MAFTIKYLITRTRSCRRFFQDARIGRGTLEELVELARLSASATNLQPLKYYLSADEDTNRRIFPRLAWAGLLEGWPGPKEGERPAAYIIALGDTRISRSFDRDLGIALQSMLLGATERQLAGCVIGSVARPELAADLNIPAHLETLVALALGKPKEKIVLETTGPGGDTRYWRDADGVHHVPKRPLGEIIIN